MLKTTPKRKCLEDAIQEAATGEGAPVMPGLPLHRAHLYKFKHPTGLGRLSVLQGIVDALDQDILDELCPAIVRRRTSCAHGGAIRVYNI